MKKNFAISMIIIVTALFFPILDFSETLTVLHAGSLTIPFRQVEKAFCEEHKGVTFDDESAGSVKIMRMITEIGKEADVIAVADYSLIPQFLIPKFAKWYVKFASNRLVIAYTSSSAYAKEINQKNWYGILMKKGVEFGFSNPNLDPCGYRTELMFQLAEKYYGIPNLDKKLIASCPPNNVKPKSVSLIADLESGELDYAFEYLSVAKQNKLKYLLLPPQIDFSSPKYSNFYSKATLTLINGKKVVGKPIVYGVTVPENTIHKELANEFVAFLLSEEGRKIFYEDGQPPILPTANVSLEKLPFEVAQMIKKYVKK
ncbi:tungstate ABC transporter substrate-binding protein WtpA [Mesoaciditoga sp.]